MSSTIFLPPVQPVKIWFFIKSYHFPLINNKTCHKWLPFDNHKTVDNLTTQKKKEIFLNKIFEMEVSFQEFVAACHQGSVATVEQYMKTAEYRPNDKDFFGWTPIQVQDVF